MQNTSISNIELICGFAYPSLIDHYGLLHVFFKQDTFITEFVYQSNISVSFKCSCLNSTNEDESKRCGGCTNSQNIYNVTCIILGTRNMFDEAGCRNTQVFMQG